MRRMTPLSSAIWAFGCGMAAAPLGFDLLFKWSEADETSGPPEELREGEALRFAALVVGFILVAFFGGMLAFNPATVEVTLPQILNISRYSNLELVVIWNYAFINEQTEVHSTIFDDDVDKTKQERG